MMIKLTCAQCQHSFSVQEKHAGKKLRCPECKAIMSVTRAEKKAGAAGYGIDEFAPAPAKPGSEEVNEIIAKSKKKSNPGILTQRRTSRVPSCRRDRI